MSVLEIRDLHVTVETDAGTTPILNGVTLTIRKGQTHAIMGPNGSGKSTLAYSIAGHPKYTVTSGTVTLDGEDVLAMTLLRLVPLAPFAIEGIVAGAVRLKLWHLAAGTAIGMLPGTLATTVFGDQLESALSGGTFNWWIVGGAVVLLGAGSWAVKRWFTAMAGRMDEATGKSR